ncbi:MAG: hypothetical protein K2Z81_28225 [Cyanobacteria bacterium]|nr:hypothetical protein [Cyanobacteriota bacterium]
MQRSARRQVDIENGKSLHQATVHTAAQNVSNAEETGTCKRAEARSLKADY